MNKRNENTVSSIPISKLQSYKQSSVNKYSGHHQNSVMSLQHMVQLLCRISRFQSDNEVQDIQIIRAE